MCAVVTGVQTCVFRSAVSSRYRVRRTSPRRYDWGDRRTGPALRARSLVPDQQSLRGRHWTTGRGWRLHFGQGIAESQDGPRRGAAEEHWWSGQGKAAPDLQLIWQAAPLCVHAWHDLSGRAIVIVRFHCAIMKIEIVRSSG